MNESIRNRREIYNVQCPEQPPPPPRASVREHPFPLSSLESPGFVEVVILKHDKREGMRKAYTITGLGKKALPLFKMREETENEIFGMGKK